MVAVAASCAPGRSSRAATPTTDVGTTTTVAPAPRRTGPLRLGVLLPAATTDASFGAPLVAAVQLAVDDINDAGGVNGERVIVVRHEEGPDIAATITRLNSMISDDHVDAVVGPASSRSALAAIDVANRNEVSVCSPTARTLTLSAYPNNRYFFRTMPSDELEAKALARALVLAGLPDTTVLYSDDEYGLAMANTMRAALSGTLTVRPIAYQTGATDESAPVRDALSGNPSTLVVIGGSDDGARILAQLTKDESNGRRIPTFVTDAMLRTDLIDKVAPGRPDGLVNVKGVAPSATPLDPAFTARLGSSAVGTNFAAYAYDCVNLIALAAQNVKAVDPRVFAPIVADVSQIGSPCDSYASCAELIASNRNIDLQGESGALDLRANGDVGSGRFDVFTFDSSGRDVFDSTISIGADGR